MQTRQWKGIHGLALVLEQPELRVQAALVQGGCTPPILAVASVAAQTQRHSLEQVVFPTRVGHLEPVRVEVRHNQLVQVHIGM